MVFRKLLGALGIGGPSVDTVLSNAQVRPGENLTGEVRITGGSQGVTIQNITLGLVTSIETDHSGYDDEAAVEFHRVVVAGQFTLGAEESKTIPFTLPMPWQTPITDIYGHHLHGVILGVRTELAVAKSADRGDLDPVSVLPLPAQERVLEAFSQLGFHIKGADLEHGHLHGVYQELPFYQEIEFYPPTQYAGRVNEVELTFVATSDGLDVVLEADKRGGFFSPNQDAFGRFHTSTAEALSTDWVSRITEWLEQVIEHRHSMPQHLQHGDGHHDHRGSGMLAGAAGGAALGIVGGMVAGEVIDEIGDFFEGDEEG